MGVNSIIKRCLEIIMSMLIIVVISPLIVILSAIIRLKLGSPIIFKQLRPGKDGKIFTMYKFRTMSDKKDENGQLLSDELRMTKLGNFLRSTSLDELPELLNVLKGDMSFVGPRPLLVEYLDRYTAEQNRRHQVKPGITGWAQVNGRNAISWDEKFKLDVWYVDNWSLGLDIRILFMTVFRVLKRDGISQQGNVTMSKFTGSNSNGVEM